MKDLANSWQSLSLSEKEGTNVDLSKNKQIQEVGLAAKFFTRRNISIDAVARTFRPLWRITNDFRIRDAGNNGLMLIRFYLGNLGLLIDF